MRRLIDALISPQTKEKIFAWLDRHMPEEKFDDLNWVEVARSHRE